MVTSSTTSPRSCVSILAESPETREDVARGREVMLANPRLIALAHQRLEECVEACMPYIEAREGTHFDRRRVDVAIALVLGVLPPRDAALPRGDVHRSQHLVHRGPRNRPRPSDLTHPPLSATPPGAGAGATRLPTGVTMATLLYRLGKTAYRRWPVFIAAWLVALIGFAALSGAISKPMVDSFSIPGIPSLKAQDLQKELFADTADAEDQANATVVVAAPKGHTLREAAYADQVDALIADLQAAPQMPTTKLAQPGRSIRRAVPAGRRQRREVGDAQDHRRRRTPARCCR